MYHDFELPGGFQDADIEMRELTEEANRSAALKTTVIMDCGIETFADGSQIITESNTGNRTVVGKLAHEEYLKRIKTELEQDAGLVVISTCTNLDGTRKAELLRRKRTNPLSIEQFGPYSWEVWDACEPDVVRPCIDEERARKLYRAVMLHGTNGMGGT